MFHLIYIKLAPFMAAVALERAMHSIKFSSVHLYANSQLTPPHTVSLSPIINPTEQASMDRKNPPAESLSRVGNSLSRPRERVLITLMGKNI